MDKCNYCKRPIPKQKLEILTRVDAFHNEEHIVCLHRECSNIVLQRIREICNTGPVEKIRVEKGFKCLNPDLTEEYDEEDDNRY